MNAESMLLLVIVLCCTGALYAYIAFPAIAAVMSRAAGPRATRRGAMSADQSAADVTPPVTVIIPAYNEERSLDAKIRNVLATDYPSDRLDVVVVSDASTDRTNDIARSFADRGVRLVVQERRSGKSAGLNQAMALSRGEIVVFTDANAMYSASTIPALVKYFARPRIGLVTGYTRYVAVDREDVAETTNVYTSLERVIKSAESRWGCCVGADGAIFAMRRSLFRPLRHDDINDLVLPLGVIEQGYECVLAADAYCTEQPGSSLDSEYRRQSRITNRTLGALWRHIGLLNPVRFGRFSFFLFSHKVVRFLVPIFLVTAFVALVLLAPVHQVYLVAAALVSLGLAAAVGLSRRRRRWTAPARLLSTMGVFLTINAAVLEGWWTFLRGRREVVWQHDRSGG
jgi:cellulose synthase/poly-beta-1,6-N-acetylglucosamine synthase-like glycosyltransferase